MRFTFLNSFIPPFFLTPAYFFQFLRDSPSLLTWIDYFNFREEGVLSFIRSYSFLFMHLDLIFDSDFFVSNSFQSLSPGTALLSSFTLASCFIVIDCSVGDLLPSLHYFPFYYKLLIN